jgi:catechol 2,3-dioxygenase-like lactoylglutathione lyase family enzyme
MPVLHSLTASFTTPDLPRNLAFYRDQLGFVVTSEMEANGRLAWVELSHGEIRLMLLAAEDPPAPGTRYDAAGVIFYFGIEGVAVTRAALAQAGFDVSPVEVTFYGMRECYLKDPDGRQLTLAEPSEPDDPVTITEL